MQLADNEKTKRIVDKLKEPAKERKIDSEMGIPGAAKELEKLKKRVVKLEKKMQGQEKRIQDLVADMRQRQMRGDCKNENT